LEFHAVCRELRQCELQLSDARPAWCIKSDCNMVAIAQYLPGKSGQHRSRANFEKYAGAGVMHRQHLIHETHWLREMFREQIPN